MLRKYVEKLIFILLATFDAHSSNNNPWSIPLQFRNLSRCWAGNKVLSLYQEDWK